MRANAIPVLLLCGISVYAASYRIMLYLLSRDRKESLHFALTCISIALYEATCVGLYEADTVAAGVFWQRGQHFVIALLVVNFANFACAIFGGGSPAIKKAIYAGSSAMALLGAFFPKLIADEAFPNVRAFSILGMDILYNEARGGLLQSILFAFIGAAMIYLISIAVPYCRRQGNRDSVLLGIGIGIVFVSLILDMLIASGLARFLYSAEYSFLVLVVMMDFLAQKRYARLLAEVESLNAELEDRVGRRTQDIHRLLDELSAKNQELTEKNSVLAELADRDGMTKLLNHAAFHRRLDEELSAARRQAFPVALAMIDLDKFKGINDAYGHQAGDEVILKAAEILLRDLRDYDAKGRDGEAEAAGGRGHPAIRDYDVPGRYGGDEFAVILPYCHAREASIVCERIRELVSRIRFSEHPELRVSASIGCSVFEPGSAEPPDASALLRRADAALYEAKAGGRGKVVVG